MFKRLLSLAMILLEAVAFPVNADDKIELYLKVEPSVTSLGEKLVVQANLEPITIKDIIVNAGECEEANKIIDDFTAILPQTLQVVEKLAIIPLGLCDLQELIIDTDAGLLVWDIDELRAGPEFGQSSPFTTGH